MNFEDGIRDAQLQALQQKEQEIMDRQKRDNEDLYELIGSIVEGIRKSIIDAAKKSPNTESSYSYHGVYNVGHLVYGQETVIERFLIKKQIFE